ncbi:MAG: S-layer homology domain-containing protein, partial [Oscillospiraceae bacterium]|nr:S-layer homology domain-containing protein [Oscillospiraceae bacterium]
MKLKRIGALFTALALALPMAAAAAEAGEEDWFFTDIANHWAKNEIQAMYETGLASGYQDSDGTYYFAPERTMSAAESILFCTRIAGIDSKTQSAIYENLGVAVKERMPENIASWAAPETAVAVELGILTLDELDDLNQTAPSSVNSSAGHAPSRAWHIPRA